MVQGFSINAVCGPGDWQLQLGFRIKLYVFIQPPHRQEPTDHRRMALVYSCF